MGTCQSGTISDPGQAKQQQEQDVTNALAKIKHKLIVMSGKGGVGKTSVSVNLAIALGARGFKVGIMDVDLHGPDVPRMLGIQGMASASENHKIAPMPYSENISAISMEYFMPNKDDAVIWRGPLKHSAINQFITDIDWGDLDFLIVDSPPGTGDEPLTVAQAFPNADGVIIVSTPQRVSQDDCRKAINFAGAVKLPVVGVIENMSGFICPHCGKETPIFSCGGGEQMATQMGVPFLGRLPLVPEVVSLCDSGQSVTAPEAPAAIRDAFNSVVEALTARS